MFEITHRVGIKSSAAKVYEFLTTDEGLIKWWTNDITGAGAVGSIIKFRFNGGGPDFKVTKLIENKTVCWQHIGNDPESWVGTEICFDIIAQEKQTFVNFTHANWQEKTDFMAHCNTKWAVFLLSLKDALETGKGSPFPNDLQIDHT